MRSTKLHKVSIILLNYNTSQFTQDCIASIIKHTKGILYEIIVVDNNSSQDDYEALRSVTDYYAVTLVRSRVNLGFSGGNMLGVQAADPDGDYYYFLNNDCVLLTDACSQLAEFMEQNPDAGLCGAQMFASNGAHQPSFGYLPTLGSKFLGHSFVRFFQPALYPPLRETYRSPVQVPFIMGSTLFFRASTFHMIGGFDTTHFLYLEEEDVAKRLQTKGYKVFLVPQAQYIHFDGQSTTRDYDIEKEYYISLFHYLRKYHSRLERLLFWFYYFVKNLKKFYRHSIYARLSWFIWRGCPMGESLRYRQVIDDSNRYSEAEDLDSYIENKAWAKHINHNAD